MAKYILTKYDDKQFPSGNTIKMYPVERIELTDDDLKHIIHNEKYIIDLELINKLKKIRDNKD